MSKICDENEWIIGPLGHELSFENKLKPLWWIPNINTYEEINKDAIAKYKPKYYLKRIQWAGMKTNLEDSQPTPEQINESLVYLDTFELWPVFGKPYEILELYRIDYLKTEKSQTFTKEELKVINQCMRQFLNPFYKKKQKGFSTSFNNYHAI